jgi:ketol-acid reductoisomerase
VKHPLYLIGMGSQAKAWAMNFKDSGLKFKVLLRSESSNWDMALKRGYELCDLNNFKTDEVATYIFLTSDHAQEEILKGLRSKVAKNSHFVFIHGVSPVKGNFRQNYPEFDFSLLAPKAIASELRFRYETKEPLAAIYECPKHREDEIKLLAKCLGITATYHGSFEEETYADLFSEQSLLCSLIPYGILSSYNILRERGIPKELAFIECFMEAKLIIDALLQYGPKDFFGLISPNALVGGEWANEVMFDKNGALQNIFKELADNVFNGKFIAKLDTTDFDSIRKNVRGRWENEELQKTYDQLKSTLIKKDT